MQHFFYVFIDQRELASTISHPHVIAISGILSFFIKGSIALAFLITFIQEIWNPFWEFRPDESDNSMLSFLHGLFQFFGRRFLRKSPVLLVLLVPLVAVFPPGSLKVVSRSPSNFDEILNFPILRYRRRYKLRNDNVLAIHRSLLRLFERKYPVPRNSLRS